MLHDLNGTWASACCGVGFDVPVQGSWFIRPVTSRNPACDFEPRAFGWNRFSPNHSWFVGIGNWCYLRQQDSSHWETAFSPTILLLFPILTIEPTIPPQEGRNHSARLGKLHLSIDATDATSSQLIYSRPHLRTVFPVRQPQRCTQHEKRRWSRSRATMPLRQRVGVYSNTRSQTCYLRTPNHLNHVVSLRASYSIKHLSLSHTHLK